MNLNLNVELKEIVMPDISFDIIIYSKDKIISKHHEDVIVEKTVVLPIGIINIDKEKFKTRCDFIGISSGEQITLFPFCMNYSRKDIIDIVHIGKDGIKSHFTNVKSRIGKYSDEELKEILTCSDDLYLEKYFTTIENNKTHYYTLHPQKKIR